MFPVSMNCICGYSFSNNDFKNGKWVLESVTVSIECWDKICCKVFLIIFIQYSLSVRNFPDSTNSTRLEQSILKILEDLGKLFFLMYSVKPLLFIADSVARIAICFDFEIFSRFGTLVLDSALVMIIVWVTPGSVSWVPSAAAEAKNAVTPGTTIDSIPFFLNYQSVLWLLHKLMDRHHVI